MITKDAELPVRVGGGGKSERFGGRPRPGRASRLTCEIRAPGQTVDLVNSRSAPRRRVAARSDAWRAARLPTRESAASKSSRHGNIFSRRRTDRIARPTFSQLESHLSQLLTGFGSPKYTECLKPDDHAGTGMRTAFLEPLSKIVTTIPTGNGRWVSSVRRKRQPFSRSPRRRDGRTPLSVVEFVS